MPNEDHTASLRILQLFATYGFRKVSMSEIAKAAEMSRQTVYNQFGSKEAVLDWAMTRFLDRVLAEAIQALTDSTNPLHETLQQGYQLWIGNHVPLMRGTAHGAELLEQAIALAANSERDYEGEFASAVTGLLQKHAMAQAEQAADLTFTLNMAAKGLLQRCRTSEEFAHGMVRILQSVLR